VKKIGKYAIIHELGEGATSAVYEALDLFVNRRTASVSTVADITVIEIQAGSPTLASETHRYHFKDAHLEILVDRLSMANTRLSQPLVDHNISVL
jgi:hypothetical protein